MPIDPASDVESSSTRRMSSASWIRCPRCGRLNHVKDTTCGYCGQSQDSKGRTRILSVPDMPQSPDLPSTNESLLPGDTITFEMGERYLTVKLQESIIFGRSTNDPDDPRPDIDLTPLRAQEQGVSRRHLRIKHKDGHLYAIDLGSSNGTWLNGHRMMSYTEYPVHSSDELRLGLFKVRVKF